MNTEHRIPVDPEQARVERWLADSQAALPHADPGRVLGPIMGQIAASPQSEGPASGGPRVRMAALTTVGLFVAVLAGGAFFGLRDGGPTPDPAVIGAPTAAATEEAVAPPAAETESEAKGIATTRDDLLDGVALETIEVEPGVHHVISDGFRSLSSHDAFSENNVAQTRIAAGSDGSLWMASPGSAYRIGSDEPVAWQWDPGRHMPAEIEVDAHGVFFTSNGSDPVRRFDTRDPDADWVNVSRGYFSVDDQALWSVGRKRSQNCGEERRKECLGASRINIGPDAAGSWPQRADVQIGPTSGISRIEALGVWPDGAGGAYVLDTRHHSGEEQALSQEIRHWTADGMDVLQVPGEGLIIADMARGGNLWARPRPAGQRHADASSFGAQLVRWDGDQWETFGPENGVPGMGGLVGGEMAFRSDYARLVADPRGGVWINPVQLGTVECRGVAYFDGDRLVTFLGDRCVHEIELAADGTVWLQVGDQPKTDGATPSLETYGIEAGAVGGTR